MSLKERIWEIVEVAEPGDRASRAFDVFILTLIFLNVLAVIAGTVDSIDAALGVLLRGFEVVSVLIFTLEYALRVWSCTVDSRYMGPVGGRLRFIASGLALVDLAAILPFYLPFLGLDLRFLRVLRLIRIVRIAKVGRYYSSLNLIRDTVRARKEELVLSVAIMVLLLVVSASVMYYAEHEVQPAAFPSIPASLWWAVVTLTTVGYGDAFPITTLGKLLASLIAILGIGMFALPTGILGAGFVEEIRKRREAGTERRCPHCGGELR